MSTIHKKEKPKHVLESEFNDQIEAFWSHTTLLQISVAELKDGQANAMQQIAGLQAALDATKSDVKNSATVGLVDHTTQNLLAFINTIELQIKSTDHHVSRFPAWITISFLGSVFTNVLLWYLSR